MKRRKHDKTFIDMTEDIEGDDDWHVYEAEIEGYSEEEKNVLRFGYMKGRYIDGLEIEVKRRGNDLIMETKQGVNLSNVFELALNIWSDFITTTRQAYLEAQREEYDDDDDY